MSASVSFLPLPLPLPLFHFLALILFLAPPKPVFLCSETKWKRLLRRLRIQVSASSQTKGLERAENRERDWGETLSPHTPHELVRLARFAPPKPVFFCSETKWKRLLRRLRIQVSASSQTKGLERAENRERDWGETLSPHTPHELVRFALRARKTLTPRFTDFFTDSEKKNDCFAVYLQFYCNMLPSKPV